MQAQYILVGLWLYSLHCVPIPVFGLGSDSEAPPHLSFISISSLMSVLSNSFSSTEIIPVGYLQSHSYGAFPLHGTVRYGSLLGGFPLGTVPGTWYFFSTTSAEVPSELYRYQNVTCKLY